MSKELYVSSTPHETKVATVEEDQLTEIYFERENEYTLAGSIYKGRVTRVLPGMQSAFVDIGLERDAFLYVTDFFEAPEEEGEIEQIPEGESAGSRSHSREPREQSVASSHDGEDQAEPAIPSSTAADFGASPSAASAPSHSETPVSGRGVDRNPDRNADRNADRGPDRSREVRDEGSKRRRGRRGRGFPDSKFSRPEESPSHRPGAPADTMPVGNDPIILPGESISKYRRGQPAAPPSQPAQPAHAAAPASSLPVAAAILPPPPPRSVAAHSPAETLAARDSSSAFTLPGESISKYRNRGAPKQAGPSLTEGSSQKFQDKAEAEAETTEESPRRPTEEIDVQAILARHNYSHDESQRSDTNSDPIQTAVSQPESSDSGQSHQPAFSSDVLEEQDLDEEESEHPSYAESLDEDEFEMEEETLERADGGQSTGHSSVAQPAQPGEPALPAEKLPSSGSQGSAEETFNPTFPNPDSSAAEEAMEETQAGEGDSDSEPVESASESAQGEAGFDVESESEEPGDEEFEESDASSAAGAENISAGRAETRGPSGYQQKVGTERRRGRRGGRRMRGPGARRAQQGPPPKISDLLKEGQETLVQIAKEPIGKKGARITSHIALPGRYLVYMPTVNHNGVSRKIASEEERQRLKRIILSERQSGSNGHQGGFIVRTAAASASEEDLRADIRFLLNLWGEIKARAESVKAPALIYHDLNLVERILRDQVSEGFSHIWVDSEQEYERVLRFINRFQPSLVKRVKLYTKEIPLFEQFNIQDEINKALKSKVWLSSGGYIVINQTEALVAIDVNTGKYVGKTQRLEDTIVKTNVDAIKEIVRQIRLRDLGGIIVIDFIDMDERRNRQKVMQALEEALKSDRAPSKVLQFNDFGLVAITRKRVKQSLERTLGQPCTYCTGTGLIKSVATVCNEIYVEMRKMMRHLEHTDVILRVNPEVGKALKANNARWLQDMEDLTSKTVIVKPDPTLHQEQFDIH
jgi:ribonuclease E